MIGKRKTTCWYPESLPQGSALTADQVQELGDIAFQAGNLIRAAFAMAVNESDGLPCLHGNPLRGITEKRYGVPIPRDLGKVRKEDGSLVTHFDLAAELYAQPRLEATFHPARIVGEESPDRHPELGKAMGGRVIYLDALDNTEGLDGLVPGQSFQAAVMDGGIPVVGVIYDPFINKLCIGVPGGKAFVNGAPARLSVTDSLRNGRFFLEGGSFKTRSGASLEERLAEKPRKVRSKRLYGIGCSTARMLIDCADGVVKGGTCPWDNAPSIAIMRAAGGGVYSLSGEPLAPEDVFSPFALTNGKNDREFLEVLLS